MRIRAYEGQVKDDRWTTIASALATSLDVFLAVRADALATEAWRSQPLAEWEWAWAFGANVEVRWRADEGQAWAAVAWEGNEPVGLPAGEELSGSQRFERLDVSELLLWGTESGGTFVEGRFRPELPYPVRAQPGARPRLTVVRYVDAGEVVWTRATALGAEAT